MRQTFQDDTVEEMSQKLYLVLSENPFWENQDNANEKSLQDGSRVKYWHNFFVFCAFTEDLTRCVIAAGHCNERSFLIAPSLFALTKVCVMKFADKFWKYFSVNSYSRNHLNCSEILVSSAVTLCQSSPITLGSGE